MQLPQRMRLRQEAKEIEASGLFDEAWYVDSYPETLLSGYRPIFQWMLAGWREHLDPNPYFSTAWYLQENPDCASSGENPLVHYIRTGASDGRDPHPLFDTARYLREHPEAVSSGLTPLGHFLRSHPAPLIGTSPRIRRPRPTGWDQCTTGPRPTHGNTAAFERRLGLVSPSHRAASHRLAFSSSTGDHPQRVATPAPIAWKWSSPVSATQGCPWASWATDRGKVRYETTLRDQRSTVAFGPHAARQLSETKWTDASRRVSV